MDDSKRKTWPLYENPRCGHSTASGSLSCWLANIAWSDNLCGASCITHHFLMLYYPRVADISLFQRRSSWVLRTERYRSRNTDWTLAWSQFRTATITAHAGNHPMDGIPWIVPFSQSASIIRIISPTKLLDGSLTLFTTTTLSVKT